MKNKPKIIAIVGTNSMFSKTETLLNYIKRRYEEILDIEVIELYNIPLFKEQNIMLGNIPSFIIELEDKISDADGIIFGITEYLNSIYSNLHIFLEWMSIASMKPLKHKKTFILSDSYSYSESSSAVSTLFEILMSDNIKSDIYTMKRVLFLNNSKDAFDVNNEIKDLVFVNHLDDEIFGFKKFLENGEIQK